MTKLDKENARQDFGAMIEKSWTYGRMTTEERAAWRGTLDAVTVKGSYRQRWNTLNSLYCNFLFDIGYSGADWRETNPAPLF